MANPPEWVRAINIKVILIITSQRQTGPKIIMRRRVSGHMAPNTASSASVQVSKISVRSSSSRQPSWSNSKSIPASLTTISLTGPSVPTPLSNYASSGAVSGGRRSACQQRTSLRNVGSCRSTWYRMPSMLGSRSKSGWPAVGSGAALTECARRALSATMKASYGSHVHQSFDNLGMRRSASFRCAQASSFSHVLCSSKVSDRRSRELTTVLSSVDVEVTHVSRRPSSRSMAYQYSQAALPATTDIRPVTIAPLQFETAFEPTSTGGMFNKYPDHESGQAQLAEAPSETREASSFDAKVPQPTSLIPSLSPGPFESPQSDASSSLTRSPTQSATENIQADKDAPTPSPPKAIEFIPLQPPTEDAPKTEENAPQLVTLLSPLSSIEFSQTRPLPQDLLTPVKPLEFLQSPTMPIDLSSPPKPIDSLLNKPMSLDLFSPPKPVEFAPTQPMAVELSSPSRPVESSLNEPASLGLFSPPKPIEFTPSQPMAVDLSSPPRPIVSSLNQPLSLGLLSPPRPVEFTQSPPMAVNLSTPPQPIGFSGVQPMSLHLLSPPKPIEFLNTQGLSLQLEARPSEATQQVSQVIPVDGSTNMATISQLASPKSPERAAFSPNLPETPRVEITAFSPPPEANAQQATVVQVNSSVPLQLQLLLTPPHASVPVSPASAVLSPQFNSANLLSSQLISSNLTSPLQAPGPSNKEQTTGNLAKRPSTFLLTPPTPLIKSQPRRPTMTGAQMDERRQSTKKF